MIVGGIGAAWVEAAGRVTAGVYRNMTATALDKFLSRHSRISRNTAQWPKGIELEVSGYLCSEAPPADLVSSVRAIVFKDDRMLVIRYLDGIYILPGGRVEDGETHVETLQRELLEEAGAEIRVVVQFGLIHLKDTTPMPKGHPCPYPDFLWPIYVASFVTSRPEARVEDGYELSPEFMPLQEVRGLALDGHDRVFLEEAVRIAADIAC